MTDTQGNPRELPARRFDEAASHLETAVAHLRVASKDMTSGAIDHACARAWAALGEMDKARDLLSENARFHAERVSAHLRARPEGNQNGS